MKKNFLLACSLVFIFSVGCFAEDVASSDEWGDIGKMQDAWDNQKIITDDMFEKVINQRTKKANEKAEKRIKKKLGEPIAQNGSMNVNTEIIKNIAQDYPTLLVPKTLLFEEVTIPPGFYRVLAAETKEGNFFINFYQGSNLIGKLPALETEDDFAAETINYAKIIYTNDDSRAKVVYGCLDYNLIAETDTK